MDIFNKQLFNEDADLFLSWDCETKKAWIKSNTNQQNDELIDEFLLTVRKDGEECHGCKEAKKGKKATKAQVVKQEAKKDPEPDETA